MNITYQWMEVRWTIASKENVRKSKTILKILVLIVNNNMFWLASKTVAVYFLYICLPLGTQIFLEVAPCSHAVCMLRIWSMRLHQRLTLRLGSGVEFTDQYIWFRIDLIQVLPLMEDWQSSLYFSSFDLRANFFFSPANSNVIDTPPYQAKMYD